MDAREASEWLSRARTRIEAFVPKANIEIERKYFEKQAPKTEHVCTLPVGRVDGYRWFSEGKMIYIMPIIKDNEAS